MNPDQIRDRLLQTFAGADIELSDMTGGGDHWSCRIISEAFEGLSPVRRHQAVYAALGDWILGNSAPIHALQLSTFTPAQAAQ